MAVNRKGHFLSPSKQAKKFATQLKNKSKNGKPLTDVEAGYRMGYLAARKDSADIYNYNRYQSKLKDMSATSRNY